MTPPDGRRPGAFCVSGSGPASWRFAVLDVPDSGFILDGQQIFNVDDQGSIVSTPHSDHDPRPQHAPDLLELQRRAAEQGLHLRLPSLNPNWELPEPVDLGGISVSEMIVRLRRAEP